MKRSKLSKAKHTLRPASFSSAARGPRSQCCCKAHETTSVQLSHSESLASTRHRLVDALLRRLTA
jgi:hypothetical protein